MRERLPLAGLQDLEANSPSGPIKRKAPKIGSSPKQGEDLTFSGQEIFISLLSRQQVEKEKGKKRMNREGSPTGIQDLSLNFIHRRETSLLSQR